MWRRYVGLCVLSFVSLIAPQLAHAAGPTSGRLLLKEVLLGTSGDASDEYVVVINNTDQAVQLQGVELEYKAATGKTWSRRALFGARELPARTSLRLTTKQAGDMSFVNGLAAAGGNLRLIASGITLDQLAWGTGDSPEGTVISAPLLGLPMMRICSAACQDSNNNVADFTPVLTSDRARVTSPVQSPVSKSSSNVISGNSDYTIEITELMPDPSSPQTDSDDEFIELHNPGSTTAVLTGWKLSDGNQTYKLDSVQLPAGQYVALKSSVTKLSLNNSGDVVSLIAPDGHIEMMTPSYGKARAGVSFGFSPAGWGWLETATPGVSNSGLSKSQSSETTKQASGTTKKSSASKATKSPQLAKVQNATADKTDDGQAQSSANKGLSWIWVLAGTGLLAVGYGAYEYRPEIIGFVTKIITKLKF